MHWWTCVVLAEFWTTWYTSLVLNFVSGTDMSRNQHLIIKNIFIFQSGKLSGDNYFEYYAGQIKRNH